MKLLKELQNWMDENNAAVLKIYTIGRSERRKWTAQFRDDAGKMMAAGMAYDVEGAILDAIKDAP